MTFGTKIRLLRNIKGYSQPNMAQMLNLSTNSYGELERDQVPPKPKRKEQIAKIFGLSVEELDSFGEGNAIFYNTVQCETGGFVGINGVVHNHNPKELIAENEKLKLQNEAKDQRIVDLEKHINRLDDVIDLLKLKFDVE